MGTGRYMAEEQTHWPVYPESNALDTMAALGTERWGHNYYIKVLGSE